MIKVMDYCSLIFPDRVEDYPSLVKEPKTRVKRNRVCKEADKYKQDDYYHYYKFTNRGAKEFCVSITYLGDHYQINVNYLGRDSLQMKTTYLTYKNTSDTFSRAGVRYLSEKLTHQLLEQMTKDGYNTTIWEDF